MSEPKNAAAVLLGRLGGMAGGRRLLTVAQVREIRKGIEPSAALARRFGVHVTTVQAVRQRRSWKWLK